MGISGDCDVDPERAIWFGMEEAVRNPAWNRGQCRAGSVCLPEMREKFLCVDGGYVMNIEKKQDVGGQLSSQNENDKEEIVHGRV